jgi:hypothetical protein
MLPRTSHRTLLILVALLTVTMLLASEAGSARVWADPLRYRYTGVVENGRGIPTHYITRGGGLVLYFFDALSQGRKSESYRLCVGRPSRAPAHCWNRRARYGVGKVTFSFTLPSGVPLGALTARWLVAGQTVASWPFFYVRGS